MKTVLVAGVGNLFFGDDGFGVEVAHRLLAGEPWPGTRVVDFGIRAIHLAYELLKPIDLLVVVDCMSRGEPPGTIYVVEPDRDEVATSIAEAHGMNVPGVLAAVRQLGGLMPATVVVGCEPLSIEPGIGLTEPVTRAIPGALDLIRKLVHTRQESS